MSALVITVEVRSVYGVDTIYPVCEKAKLFAAIAGTKTLTIPVVQRILDLGYEVKYRHPDPLERIRQRAALSDLILSQPS